MTGQHASSNDTPECCPPNPAPQLIRVRRPPIAAERPLLGSTRAGEGEPLVYQL
ncbi:MAG: hypothetical protein Q8P67_24905 [archaeon]|nr:hypothetical protein [archaeon]